jgi:hypothetical protein
MWPPRTPQHAIRVRLNESLDHGHQISMITGVEKSIWLRQLDIRSARTDQRQHRIKILLEYAAGQPSEGIKKQEAQGTRRARARGQQ